MARTVTDTIERTMTLVAPIERTWAAITDPEEVRKWFGDLVEIDLRPGGEARFGWGEEVYRARIERVEPPHHFSYRWVNGIKDDLSVPFDEMPSTVVEFTLEAISEGTRLHLVESGFASLAEDRQKAALEENTGGWQAELQDLKTYLGPRVDDDPRWESDSARDVRI